MNPLRPKGSFALNLFGPGTVDVGGERAAILICHEQLLTWPMLRSALERPTLLVAISNEAWTVATIVPRVNIHVFVHGLRGSNSHQTSHAAAKDFTLDDVTFRITAASLYVNGTAVSDTPVIGEVDGPLAWFYFPGRGRFLVSLAPRAGYSFQKAGTVRGSVLAFGWGADRYEVKAHSGILGDVHGPAFNLYVLRDTQSTTGRIPALGSGWRVEELVTAR